MRPCSILLGLAALAAAPGARADDLEPFDAAEQIEIIDKSDGQKLRESARAVTVIDAAEAHDRTADLGEVLSRAQGLQVRRSGGLGSSARISLDGLYDDQIRFFLDGVPLELAGWGLGIANVPVELVQRIDVHRGVAPIALGADALGGAIDLVTDPSWVNRAAASYQVGSFGTHRAIAAARARDGRTGAAFGATMFFDQARNDYPVDVEVADVQGHISEARVSRFHDAYRAGGASVDAGVVQRGPLERASIRLFWTDFDKELQHNVAMTVPYAKATYGGVSRGATVDTRVAHGRWRARLVGGAARRSIDFDDRADAVYDWFGNRVRDRVRPGEVGEAAYQRISETGVFARGLLECALGPHHTVRVATAPTLIDRSGTSFLHDPASGRDPLTAKRRLRQVVTGLEYELRASGDRLHSIAFVKHYGAWLDAEDVAYMTPFVPISRATNELGAGELVRYAVAPGVIAKASYEWATRLPSVDEVFGDGVLVRPNLVLAPERSHNANLGVRLERDTRLGGLDLDVTGFARLTDQMIIPIQSDRSVVYQNVYAARILGVATGASWISPGEAATLEASLTVQDLRNASSDGTFGQFEGDRIPNRPWLLGALAGTLRTRDAVLRADELAVFAHSRYVREFFRSWESAGTHDSKQVIPSQLVHGAGVTYTVHGATTVTSTLEVQNVLDARVYDSFGVQRPGRAVFLKLAVEL